MSERARVRFADGRVEERFVRPSTRGQRPFRSGFYVLDGDLRNPDYVKVRRAALPSGEAEWREVRRTA